MIFPFHTCISLGTFLFVSVAFLYMTFWARRVVVVFTLPVSSYYYSVPHLDPRIVGYGGWKGVRCRADGRMDCLFVGLCIHESAFFFPLFVVLVWDTPSVRLEK